VQAAVVVEGSPTDAKGPRVRVRPFDRGGRPLPAGWGIPRGETSPAVLIHHLSARSGSVDRQFSVEGVMNNPHRAPVTHAPLCAEKIDAQRRDAADRFAAGLCTKNGPFWSAFFSDDLNTRLVPGQESLFATKISIRIEQTPPDIIHEFCCLLNRLLLTRFASMF
jgi:hypothetical protein